MKKVLIWGAVIIVIYLIMNSKPFKKLLRSKWMMKNGLSEQDMTDKNDEIYYNTNIFKILFT